MATCSDNVDASLILDTLIEKTGITEEQLDGTVEEGHLLKLAGLFGGWEKYVGVTGLGLNEAQKADVRDAVFREGHEKGMIKALTFWLKRNPYPSYRSLIEILLKLEEGLLAANVCNTVTTLTFGSKESRPVSGDVPTLEPFEPTDKSAADTTTSVLPIAMPSNDAALSEKVKWFEAQFYSLQELAQVELTREGVTVENFRQSLARLSSSIKAEHESFLKGKYATFKKAEAIEDIFFHLNFYLSFIDFSLLEHIINHFGSSDLKKKMSQYSMDMVQFRKTTTVAEIFPHLSGRPEPPPEYVKLEMEFDYNPHTYTLEDLEQTRLKLGREFSLSKLALFLVKIVTGSVVLVCILPEGMVWRIDAEKYKNSFFDLKLVRLHLNNECLYRIDLSRKFAHNINNAILSTPDSCGLAIITDLDNGGSLGFNDRYSRLRNRFKDCNFALYNTFFPVDKLELYAIIYAVSHYLNLPNTSNYPILFMVNGPVSKDVNTFLVYGHKIDIGKDIIKPLVSCEHLADNPKIIIIETYPQCRSRIPHSQNFIVTLFNSDSSDPECNQDIFFKMIDIEEIFLRLESQNFKRMTVKSHLKQPIYFCQHSSMDMSMGSLSNFKDVVEDVVGDVNDLIKSTQNPKGLAIIIALKDHLRATNTKMLTGIFSKLDYVAKSYSNLEDVVSTVTYHTELSDHPIVFAISGQVAGDDPNHLLYKGSRIDIYYAILKPLCIPYLSKHPKIFLIMAYTDTETSLDLSHLRVPFIGNFIFAYIHSKTIQISSETTEILQHALQNTKASIDEVLDDVRRNIPGHCSMKVISRLDKPVYIHDNPVDLHRGIGDATGTGIST